MSEEVVDEQFKSVAKRVDEAYDQTAAELKDKVAKAKAKALKRISS